MNNPRQYVRLLVLAGALLLCALALPGVAHAEPVMLSPTVTNLGGGLFGYNFTVMNNSTFNLSAISLFSLPTAPNAIQNPSAPIGFNVFPDAALGRIDFVVANTGGVGAGTSLSGFRFNSPFLLSTVSFTALALDANGNILATFTGVTLIPNPPGAIPEPATMILLCTGIAGLVASRRRRRIAEKRTGDGEESHSAHTI